MKLRRQGLAGGGRGGLGGLSPQFAVWRHCGQGWAVRRSAVRRRCPFRRQPSAAAVRRRRLPLHQAQRAAVRRRCPLPSAVCCRPLPSAALRRVPPWGLLGGCPPCGFRRGAPPRPACWRLPLCARGAPPEAAASRGQGRTWRRRGRGAVERRRRSQRANASRPPCVGRLARRRSGKAAEKPGRPTQAGGAAGGQTAGRGGAATRPEGPGTGVCAPAPCLQRLRGAHQWAQGGSRPQAGRGGALLLRPQGGQPPNSPHGGTRRRSFTPAHPSRERAVEGLKMGKKWIFQGLPPPPDRPTTAPDTPPKLPFGLTSCLSVLDAWYISSPLVVAALLFSLIQTLGCRINTRKNANVIA